MHVLTIKQPWASAIMYGDKRYENRTWQPPKWLIGQRLLIHTSKTLDKSFETVSFLQRMGYSYFTASDVLRLPSREKVPMARGALIGSTKLTAVNHIEDVDDRWAFGPWCWEFNYHSLFQEPVPWRGRLGLWQISDEEMRGLLESAGMEFPYYFAWGNNSKRATMKGRRLRVIARGSMNSALVEFENGERSVVSRNALRKIKKGNGSC